jgi:hypothetical protein
MAVSTPVNAEARPSNWVSFSALVTAIDLIPVVHRLPFTVEPPLIVHRRSPLTGFTDYPSASRGVALRPSTVNGEQSTV